MLAVALMMLAPPGCVLIVQAVPLQSVKVELPLPITVASICSTTDCVSIIVVLSNLLRVLEAIELPIKAITDSEQIAISAAARSTSIMLMPASFIDGCGVSVGCALSRLRFASGLH